MRPARRDSPEPVGPSSRMGARDRAATRATVARSAWNARLRVVLPDVGMWLQATLSSRASRWTVTRRLARRRDSSRAGSPCDRRQLWCRFARTRGPSLARLVPCRVPYRNGCGVAQRSAHRAPIPVIAGSTPAPAPLATVDGHRAADAIRSLNPASVPAVAAASTSSSRRVWSSPMSSARTWSGTRSSRICVRPRSTPSRRPSLRPSSRPSLHPLPNPAFSVELTYHMSRPAGRARAQDGRASLS